MSNQTKSGEKSPVLRYEKERHHFRALILSNPNYFGNIKASQLKPVLQLQGDTTYEEIGCVGFQPQFNRLEAVVYVKQPSGYGGAICSSGTPEFVRFYISFDDGATWQDQGLASFTAFDIPTDVTKKQRLEYAVTRDIKPPKKFCFASNLARVRAILSWNVPPPPNDPTFTPVWGNVHDTHIQIDPLKLLVLGDVLKELEVKIPPQLVKVLDLKEPITAAEPKALSLAELQEAYRGENVEPHRFALAEIKSLINQPSAAESLMASSGFTSLLTTAGINLGDIVGKLFPTDGNTTYEQLECIGLDPNLDMLVGIIRVKLPNGYSGGPCTAGSREYVTFWGDFDGNGSFETCLGTTSVNVYDIQELPKDGLEYSVFLPVDLSKYRQPCQKGAKVVRIRAIMAWQEVPPCPNPNFIPVWGNRLETLIHIKPGVSSQPGTHFPFIETVGNMAVPKIDPFSGLANGTADGAGFTAQDSPFGGEVIISGHIGNSVDLSSGAPPLKYRVTVTPDGGAPQRLTNAFGISRTQLLDGIWSFLPSLTQSVDPDDFYTYREDLVGGPGNAQTFVALNVLARWQTGGLTGKWHITIDAKDAANIIYTGNTVTVYLDNAAPVPDITITSGGGACADFKIGDVIEGTYSVTDEHFGSLTFDVLPPMGGSFTAPVPLPRAYPLVSTNGEAGVWKLDTTGMPRCGYVVRIRAWDRTIVNSGFIGFGNEKVVGLCLREASE